jgi:succinylglutamate desuccinylase
LRESPPRRALGERTSRVLGRYTRGQPGPVVVLAGAIHGNEPAGVVAIENVLRDLASREVALRGTVVGVIGNLGALRRGVRYVDQDLNRLWTVDGVKRLRESDPSRDDAEQAEQRDLLRILEPLMLEARHGFILVDLHSTSSVGAPFVIAGDTVENRRLAQAVPLPLILGLEEILSGTSGEYVSEQGHVCLCVEGGQHDAESTHLHHEAAVWIALVASGALAREEVPDLGARARMLKDAARGLAGVVDVRYRHGIGPDTGFAMKPGYRNFQSIAKGELLATETARDVRAAEDGILLMPLYQAKGDDGFFTGRAVRRSWLRFSSLARRLRLEFLLRLFPGVRAHPTRPETLIVSPFAARALRDAFTLFGYRRVRPQGDGFLVSRHRQA